MSSVRGLILRTEDVVSRSQRMGVVVRVDVGLAVVGVRSKFACGNGRGCILSYQPRPTRVASTNALTRSSELRVTAEGPDK